MTYVLLVVMILVVALVLLLTRRRVHPRPAPPAPPPPPVARVRVGGRHVTERTGPGTYTGRLTPRQIRLVRDHERSHLPTAKD